MCILLTPSILFQIPSLEESKLSIPFSSNSVSRRKQSKQIASTVFHIWESVFDVFHNKWISSGEWGKMHNFFSFGLQQKKCAWNLSYYYYKFIQSVSHAGIITCVDPSSGNNLSRWDHHL